MSYNLDNKSRANQMMYTKNKNVKNKTKNDMSSYTPNKYQKSKDNLLNNKPSTNNTKISSLNNNNYNINNNISININIDMTNNRNKSVNTANNKNKPKKKPISIKKEDIKNNNNNNLIFNTLKSYNQYNVKKTPFHIRIKSENFGFNKNIKNNNKNYNNKLNNNSVINNNNNKNFFNSTGTAFNPNKTAIDPKNISIISIENNEQKKDNNDHTLSINTGHHVMNNRSIQGKKNYEKKRDTFSPKVNRELLNQKQNSILNYSIENRKYNYNHSNKTIISEIKNQNMKNKNNFRDTSSSPFIKNNQISLKKKNNINNNINMNNKNINSKKQVVNYKVKSPINKSIEIRNNFKNQKNELYERSPSGDYKNIQKLSNLKNNAEKEKEEEKKKKEEELKKQEEEKKKLIEEEKRKEEERKRQEEEEEKKKREEEEENKRKEEERKKEEEKKKKIEEEKKKKIEEEKREKEKQNKEKKRTMNQSKSQNDIGSDILKKFEEKKGEKLPQNLKPSDPASKTIFRIDSICKKGFAGPGVKKTNQDNFFIYKNFLDSPDHIFLGVCDGHGMFGHDVSGYLVNQLPQNLNTALLKNNIKSITSPLDFPLISNVTSLTFVQTNINLVNDDKVDSTFSGTTCSSLIFCPQKIISANVGDSRCVLGKFDGKIWKAKNLTRDQKPNEEDEKKRILEKGGRIEAYRDEEGEFVGPERVWLKTEDVPGLAMSRSFGDDVAHTVGVIAQPEIFEYNFVNEDKFVLLASDGIWEFISSDECVNIVKDYYLKDDIEGALSYLYKESSKRWIMEEEVIDDITLIILFLN